MLLQRTTGALLLAAGSVSALRDAAPFFMLSPEPLNIGSLSTKQIATADYVDNSLLSILNYDCKQATYYILIQQPGVKASDISKQSMHQLYTRLASTTHTTVMSASVPEVVGEWDLDNTAEQLASSCGLDVWRHDDAAWMLKETSKAVMPISLPALEGTEHSQQLAETDKKIDSLIRLFSPEQPWTIIFSGSHKTAQAATWAEENQDPPYEMDEPYPSGLHTDLRRDVELHRQELQRRQGNSTDNPQSGLPLFEKYKFLSPAIFMGLTVSILLMLILYVGITAIAGLEVSYYAFSKEMGKQAQNTKVPQ